MNTVNFLCAGSGAVSSADELYTMICDMAEGIKNFASKITTDEMCMKLNSWNKDYITLPSEDRDILSLQITTTPDVVKTFLTFADSLFSGSLATYACIPNFLIHHMGHPTSNQDIYVILLRGKL